MPKKLEEKLKREAKDKGLNKKETGAYVYGTLSSKKGRKFQTSDGYLITD